MTHSFDAEYVASISEQLIAPPNDPYVTSPFYSLKQLNPKTKGSRMEQICEDVLTEQGYAVEGTSGTDSDRSINGKRVEIKGSFLWAPNYNFFKWLQIRPDQDYDYVVFMAFYPKKLDIFAASKETVLEHLLVQNENGHWPYSQHGGMTVPYPSTLALQGLPEEYTWLTPLHLTPLAQAEG